MKNKKVLTEAALSKMIKKVINEEMQMYKSDILDKVREAEKNAEMMADKYGESSEQFNQAYDNYVNWTKQYCLKVLNYGDAADIEIAMNLLNRCYHSNDVINQLMPQLKKAYDKETTFAY